MTKAGTPTRGAGPAPAAWVPSRPAPSGSGTPPGSTGGSALSAVSPAVGGSSVQVYYLSNGDATTHNVGDVVALTPLADQQLTTTDNWWDSSQYFVAMSTVASGKLGMYGRGLVLVKDVTSYGAGLASTAPGMFFIKSSSARAVVGVSQYAGGFGTPRMTLGHFVQTAPTDTGGLTLAWFHGNPQDSSDEPFVNTRLSDDFMSYDVILDSQVTPGVWNSTGKVVYSDLRWWMTGTNPATDQGTNGRITCTDAGASGAAMYLSKDGTGTIAKPWIYTEYPSLRVRAAQKGITSGAASTRRLGVADATLNAEVANGIYFQWIRGGNFFCRVRKAGVTVQNVDSGISALIGETSMRSFEIRVTPAEIAFFLGGSIIASATLTGPTNGPVVNLGPALGFSHSGGFTDNGFIVDRIDMASYRIAA